MLLHNLSTNLQSSFGLTVIGKTPVPGALPAQEEAS